MTKPIEQPLTVADLRSWIVGLRENGRVEVFINDGLAEHGGHWVPLDAAHIRVVSMPNDPPATPTPVGWESPHPTVG